MARIFTFVGMIIRSKSPLRIGLAGGGTDVSPYSDLYGGALLNATIDLFAYASIEPTSDGSITLHSADRKETLRFPAGEMLPLDGTMDLIKGICNRVMKEFTGQILSFTLTTSVDAPPGSGLGSSSSLAVAVLAAFSEWLHIPLGEYEMAHLAFEIERKDLRMAGGKQDQYCATFGGFNFMEFLPEDKVIVNPLRIRQEVINELEGNILLYYTGTSRLSSLIIEQQSRNVERKNEKSIEAMHQLKEQSMHMKEALLRGQLNQMGEILHQSWQHKKQMADGISNPVIDEIYETARKAGATGGKISGAGGGGFMFFYCPGNTRYAVQAALRQFGGEFHRYQFTKHGVTTWQYK